MGGRVSKQFITEAKELTSFLSPRQWACSKSSRNFRLRVPLATARSPRWFSSWAHWNDQSIDDLHLLSRLCMRRSTLSSPSFTHPWSSQTRRALQQRCFDTHLTKLWAKGVLTRHLAPLSSDSLFFLQQYRRSNSRVSPCNLGSSCLNRPWV